MFDTFLLIFVAIDAEEELLLASKESRLKELGRMQGGRQELIVVASLIDHIPNLAGLARTCEVSHRRGQLLHMHRFGCIQHPKGEGVGVVHSFEYSGLCICNMKSRTVLCSCLNLQRTVNSSFWGGKESESKNDRFWLFQKPQRTGGVFLKEPVENWWLYRQSSD